MLDVSIMEKQIGKILSTLRKQEVYLWTRTPFQMQWLKLLQSYVDFTYAQTDKLTSDPATKETMIQVLVTELMLSNHSTHKIYDSQLIQALLYRLVSLMNVSDPNKTLQKAFRSLSRQQNLMLPYPSIVMMHSSSPICSARRKTMNR